MHPLPAGGLSLLPNFQKGGLIGSHFLEGEILNNKKIIKQKCLSTITKILNWQSLTSLLLKDKIGVKDEKC